jgi:hypothetical protein
MDRQILLGLMKQSGGYVLANGDGVSQAESLRRLPGDANPFNWILGHVAFWRNEVLQMLQLEPVWQADAGVQYRGNPGGHEPLSFDPASALTVEYLLTDIGVMQERLEQWAQADGQAEIPRHLLSLLLHEAYHAGQLVLLDHMRDGPRG